MEVFLCVCVCDKSYVYVDILGCTYIFFVGCFKNVCARACVRVFAQDKEENVCKFKTGHRDQ